MDMAEQVLDLVSVLRGSHIFKRLSDAEVADVADFFSVQTFAEDAVIFKEKESADAFCFVLSGKVRLWRKLPARQEDIALCDAEDYFGQDTLRPYRVNQVSAQAHTPVTIAILSYKKYRDLLYRFPILEDTFVVIFNSYQLSLRQPLLWRTPRETVHYLGRQHPFFLLLKQLPALALLALAIGLGVVYFVSQRPAFLLLMFLFVLGVGAVWAWWVQLNWANNLMIITNRRAVYQERVVLFYDSQRETPLDAIVSEDIQTDFWGRWLGFGNLLVRTYTGMLPMRRVAAVREVKAILDEQRQQAMARSQRVRKRTLNEAIAQRLQKLPPTPQQQEEEDKIVPAQVRPGWFQTTLSQLFNVREQKGRLIIYRTHAFILIKRAGLYVLSVWALWVFILWGMLAWGFVEKWLVIAFLFLVSLVAVGFAAWNIWDWRNDQYLITENELVDVYKKPLGKEVRRSAPIENIQTIDFARPNFWALLFDFGTVMIRVGNDMLTFNNVPSPASVQREIFERFLEKKFLKEKRQAEQEQERIVEWIQAYDEYRRRYEGPLPPVAQP
jgi:hypothetical protein